VVVADEPTTTAAEDDVNVSVVEATVAEKLTVYVPMPPVPVRIAVTTCAVAAVMVPPVTVMPTEMAPDVTAVTVSVVVEMEPVMTAAVVA